jgi:DNA-binding transcriptional ArsR family regulator
MSIRSNVNPGAYMIRLPAQLRALAAPARQEVVDALVAAGPSSVAELADQLGRAPDSLYFHLRRLEKVGLVLEVDRRKSGRHVAVVYDVPGRPMRIVQTRAVARPMDDVVGSVLRLAQRDYRRGLRDPGAVLEGRARSLWAGRVKGWIAGEDLTRVNSMLEEIQRIVRTGRPAGSAAAIGFTFVLAPTGKTRDGAGRKPGNPRAGSASPRAGSRRSRSTSHAGPHAREGSES